MNLSTILRKIEHIISISEDGREDSLCRRIELMGNHARSAKEELSKLQKNMTSALDTIEYLHSSREQQLKKAFEKRQLDNTLDENVALKEQLKKVAKKRKPRRRGVIFNSDEVNATLGKYKTQMRRVVSQETYCDHHGYSGSWKEIDGLWHYVSVHGGGEPIKCPYGRIRDILWVRETWGYHGSTSGGSPEEHYKTVSYHADNKKRDIHFDTFEEMEKLGPHQNIKIPDYMKELDDEDYDVEKDSLLVKWWEGKRKISPAHMSLWASRLFLKIKDIRIERLQDISPQDAKAEGHKEWHSKKDWVEKLNYKGNYINSFREDWESMNVCNGYDWEINPWVWVVKFKVVETKASVLQKFAEDVIDFNIKR